MASTKTYSIEKRITRSAASTMVDKESGQKSSASTGSDGKSKEVDVGRKKEVKKKKTVVSAGNEYQSGL